MKIDIATLKQSKTSFDFLVKPTEINFEGEGIQPLEEIRVEGNISNGVVQTDLEGQIFAKVELDCSRCLEPVETDLEIPFEVSFMSAESFSEQEESEVDTDDLDVSVLEDDEINMIEVVREQIILDLATQVFCKDDCKGLCPECGQNQNLINCKCKENEVDPRWSALKNLKLDK